MFQLISSDSELLSTFNELKKLEVTFDGIKYVLRSNNADQYKWPFIPNLAGCGRSLAVAALCGTGACPACCLAEIGVVTRCCSESESNYFVYCRIENFIL